eukprot:g55274.t1
MSTSWLSLRDSTFKVWLVVAASFSRAKPAASPSRPSWLLSASRLSNSKAGCEAANKENSRTPDWCCARALRHGPRGWIDCVVSALSEAGWVKLGVAFAATLSHLQAKLFQMAQHLALDCAARQRSDPSLLPRQASDSSLLRSKATSRSRLSSIDVKEGKQSRLCAQVNGCEIYTQLGGRLRQILSLKLRAELGSSSVQPAPLTAMWEVWEQVLARFQSGAALPFPDVLAWQLVHEALPDWTSPAWLQRLSSLLSRHGSTMTQDKHFKLVRRCCALLEWRYLQVLEDHLARRGLASSELAEVVAKLTKDAEMLSSELSLDRQLVPNLDGSHRLLDENFLVVHLPLVHTVLSWRRKLEQERVLGLLTGAELLDSGAFLRVILAARANISKQAKEDLMNQYATLFALASVLNEKLACFLLTPKLRCGSLSIVSYTEEIVHDTERPAKKKVSANALVRKSRVANATLTPDDLKVAVKEAVMQAVQEAVKLTNLSLDQSSDQSDSDEVLRLELKRARKRQEKKLKKAKLRSILLSIWDSSDSDNESYLPYLSGHRSRGGDPSSRNDFLEYALACRAMGRS